MNRFHVHVAVPDLQESIRFYSAMFGSEPSVVKDDYAKWMLEDPRVNFAISKRGSNVGINHLGFQAESDDELERIRARLDAASSTAVVEEKNASCCYARSDKYWVQDPAGIAWESFRTLGSIPFFGSSTGEPAAASGCGSAGEEAGGCCAPSRAETPDRAATQAAKACCS
jgi:catechol 2,3-dioxygenase-like lactoylglutathione lyase family enzyme